MRSPLDVLSWIVDMTSFRADGPFGQAETLERGGTHQKSFSYQVAATQRTSENSRTVFSLRPTNLQEENVKGKRNFIRPRWPWEDGLRQNTATDARVMAWWDYGTSVHRSRGQMGSVFGWAPSLTSEPMNGFVLRSSKWWMFDDV